MTHLIQLYRGRVVDSPGDNILAEFTSVVDAVNCGVELQRELAERNAVFFFEDSSNYGIQTLSMCSGKMATSLWL